MLDYDGRIGDKGPEVVWEKPGVALEVGEEGWGIGIIVRICIQRQIAIFSLVECRADTYNLVSPIKASSIPLFPDDSYYVLGPCSGETERFHCQY